MKKKRKEIFHEYFFLFFFLICRVFEKVFEKSSEMIKLELTCVIFLLGKEAKGLCLIL